MTKRPIYNFRSNKPNPPRFCDIEIDDGKAYLSIKRDKGIERILWDDVVYQVNAAKSENQPA